MARSPEEGRPDAPGSSFDHLRVKVFLGFSGTTAAFSGLMAVGELVLRGPFAFQTIAFVITTLLFSVLWAVVRKTRRTSGATAVGLGVYLVLFLVIERMNPGVSEGIRVAMFAFPLTAVLLSGLPLASLLWVAASIDTALLVDLDGDRVEVAVQALNAMGACFVGAILMTLGWVFDRERRRAHALATARETDLLDAVDRAEEAAEARSKFLANMSHEIRTPMNGVLGLSQVLVDEPLAPAQRELAETILSSGQSLLHILDDILDLSKLDAGALVVTPEPTDLGQLIREVTRLMRARVEEAGLELRLEGVAELPPWLAVDGHRVRQVLTNLLGNAVKFTSMGRITVRARYARGRLGISVADTGIGMSPEVLHRVFLPFEQADAGTARKYGGTGLGLSICRRLCELMGGTIEAESVEGQGSEFRFEIEAPETDPPEVQSRDLGASLRGLRVLVAEDNRVNRVVVKRLLEKLGAVVVVVENGGEAVARIARESFDVVLMDLQMPEVDGLEATRRLRAMPAPAGTIPVFALTASVMTEERRRCEEAGMNGVLTKPIELERLAQTLATLVAEEAVDPIEDPKPCPAGCEGQ